MRRSRPLIAFVNQHHGDSGLEASINVTNKIIGLMATYVFTTTSGDEIKLGLTGGIAIYPLHAANAGDLLRAADAALYQAKKHERGSYMIASGMTGPLRSVEVKP